MPLRSGKKLVDRLRDSAALGGDLTSDEVMIMLRGRAPGDAMERERELTPEREEQAVLPRARSKR